MTVEDVRAFFDDLHGSRLDRIEGMLAEDVAFGFPGHRFGGRHEGKRRVLVFLKANRRLFTGGLRFHVHWVGIDADHAVAQWTNEGTTREGTPYANRGVTIFRETEGRIVEVQDYLDTERIAETWPR
jgi:ketosteroid isomerase-like protein